MTSDGGSTADNLWDKARNLLVDDDDRLRLKNLEKLEVIQGLHDATKKRQEMCLGKRWKFKNRKGEQVIVRDLLAKIALWIDKFKKIGDQAVQYDPGHAALPWACVRLLLQITVNDIETFGAMIEGLERISGLITYYAIFECIYLQGNYKAKKDLEAALVKLYEVILHYLLKAEKYYKQDTFKRVVKSIAQQSPTDLDRLLEMIDEREGQVTQLSILIRRESQLQIDDTTQRMEDLLKGLQQPFLLISEQVQDLRDDLSKDRRRRLLQWLSKIPYRQHHRAVRKDVLPDSGQWLLENVNFRNWLRSSSSSLLWIHGIPGSGKTKLTSIAVQHVVDQSQGLSYPIPIAYFYCMRNPAEPERADPGEIANALLKQLTGASMDKPIPEFIAGEYLKRSEEADEDGLDPTRLYITDVFGLLLKLLDRNPAIIFIDALDECDSRRRHELFRFLTKLREESNSVVKICVTSRDDGDIVQEFSNLPNIRIAASDNHADIRYFVSHELQLAMQNRTLLHGQVPEDLQQRIIQKLVDGAQGMFRWVSLQLQQLCDPARMKTAEDIEDALVRLPQTLAELYTIIYNQVSASADYSRVLAQNVINWLLCAQQPLSPAQLRSAASAHLKGPASTDQILDVCCNLVVYDTIGDAFGFAHLSVREFFESHREYESDEIHAYAAKHCLELVVQQLGSTLSVPRQHADSRVLTRYAMLFWAAHYERIDRDYRQEHMNDLMIAFFRKPKQDIQSPFEKWVELIHTYNKQLDAGSLLASKLVSVYARPPAPQLLVVAFGMVEVLGRIVDSTNWDWNIKNASGQQPMHLAATYGHVSLFSTLSEIDRNFCYVKDGLGRSPLTHAALNDRTDVARFLCAHGVDVDQRDGRGKTPLCHAATQGHTDVCGFLLGKDAMVDSRSDNQCTPLYYAAQHGHLAVVQLLQTHGADLDAFDHEDYTPLSCAAHSGMTSTVRFLLDQGAKMDLEDKYGQTALARAAAAGHEATVGLLVDRGCNANQRDICGHTPLSRAAWHGHVDVLTALIERDIPVNTQDDEGRTPLSWAAGNGHLSSVQALLAKVSADETLVDLQGRSPLWWARQGDHEHIISLLCKSRSLTIR
ncbi:MAG: hypothetical protein M1822_002937 [Bathelium mastoideum]|nr:MAG: hypothetical protein M1822_002937 [Bathelium mastoideum]